MVALDTVFDLLCDERRRYALYYLHERDGPVAVEELISAVVKWETDGRPSVEPSDAFDRVEIDLEHVHLPKSADVEFVQYDPDRGLVQVQGSPPEFDALLTVARLIERPDR